MYVVSCCEQGHDRKQCKSRSHHRVLPRSVVGLNQTDSATCRGGRADACGAHSSRFREASERKIDCVTHGGVGRSCPGQQCQRSCQRRPCAQHARHHCARVRIRPRAEDCASSESSTAPHCSVSTTTMAPPEGAFFIVSIDKTRTSCATLPITCTRHGIVGRLGRQERTDGRAASPRMLRRRSAAPRRVERGSSAHPSDREREMDLRRQHVGEAVQRQRRLV